MSRQMVVDKITKEADKIAIEYNKTKDPGLRDQWYKLLKQVPQEPLDYPLFSHINLGYNSIALRFCFKYFTIKQYRIRLTESFLYTFSMCFIKSIIIMSLTGTSAQFCVTTEHMYIVKKNFIDILVKSLLLSYISYL